MRVSDLVSCKRKGRADFRSIGEGNARSEPVSGADEAEIRKAVSEIGFEVPEEIGFKEREYGVYQFETAMSETDEGIVNGTFTCT